MISRLWRQMTPIMSIPKIGNIRILCSPFKPVRNWRIATDSECQISPIICVLRKKWRNFSGISRARLKTHWRSRNAAMSIWAAKGIICRFFRWKRVKPPNPSCGNYVKSAWKKDTVIVSIGNRSFVNGLKRNSALFIKWDSMPIFWLFRIWRGMPARRIFGITFAVPEPVRW